MTIIKGIRTMAMALAMLAAVGTQAQTASEVNASQKMMTTASTPCNQGPEAFKQFIVKFNTDSTFMAQRLALTPEQKAEYGHLLKPGNFEAKVPYDRDGEECYQCWGELQYNKAYLDCGLVDSYVEHTFEFVRRNGVWYLGKVVAE